MSSAVNQFRLKAFGVIRGRSCKQEQDTDRGTSNGRQQGQ